jgi:hypothetical protein
MNAKLLFLSLSLLVLMGCKKKGGDSKPDIKLKDVKVQLVTTPNGSGTLLDIDVEVSDKEGDVRDSVFIMKLDAAGIACPANTKDLSKNVPLYPDDGKQTVTFRIKFSTIPVLDYVNLGGSACPRKDTSRFQIWVKDRLGNLSDTVLTDRIGL